MTSTASNAWMPTGRHEINIGTSLMRSLKARKGGPVKNSKAKPDREFYSFRYNFKPESVDPTKPGSIEIKKAKEEGGPSSVNVTRPSTQNETGVNYVGQERSARDVDCVLIYDEELQTFTLEKIETYLTLQHDPRTVHAPRLANSPVPPAAQRAPAAAVREEEEESEGEIPEPAKSKPPSRLNASVVLPKTKPTTPVPQPAPRALPPSLPPKPVKSTPTPKPVQAPVPAKPAPVAASSKSAPATAPPKPRPRPIGTSAFPFKGTNKRELPADTEETPATVRRAVQPPPFKKAKVVPEKKEQPVALALPGAGASPALALPSASSASASTQPPSLSLPTSSSIVTLPPAPAATISALDPAVAAIADSDDDDDDWEETIVPPLVPAAAAAPTLPPVIVMEEIEPSAFTPAAPADGGEDLDDFMDQFEQELLADPDADMDADGDADGDAEADDDDFLAGAMSPAERQPVADVEFVDEDYSSSDSSDED
ncbi:uncharacterized protein TRAVEDRAFT_44622 [Trametes versicolor FP-101664 SS1]|uniref:uncharacterized protein n=1 Tax=Trametes versicolor (strain FP-101664) TaxID=717944 RepID=UPI0004623304|nr:uncharacterized protein TRAVEDRAFT_44622 [Trametes versicolor FP-101664 SS1]EIW61799.1 hypothetical protein TRAVEDRAFT_44622 [Trametes versicolor FP-101664 SS1]